MAEILIKHWCLNSKIIYYSKLYSYSISYLYSNLKSPFDFRLSCQKVTSLTSAVTLLRKSIIYASTGQVLFFFNIASLLNLNWTMECWSFISILMHGVSKCCFVFLVILRICFQFKRKLEEMREKRRINKKLG